MDEPGEPINFFEHEDAFVRLVGGRTPVMFLDYDGTLTPIVATPDKALLSEDMRDTVARLSKRYTTAIVSGRATDDVRAKVKLDQLMYAGSHGFEIYMPGGEVIVNQEARNIRPVIDRVYESLRDKLKDIPGALVEHVKYTISAHYRLVDERRVGDLEAIVDDVLRHETQLRKTCGKKVFELRPRIDWDKGKAVNWILDTLNVKETACPIYIGDDTTDEDAFRVLKNVGLGIVVRDPERASAAPFYVDTTEDVKRVLEHIMVWKGGS